MGLAMARERKTPANEHGLYNRRSGVIYASDQVHMAVLNAVAFLGIGRDNLHYVPYRSVRSGRTRRKAGSRLQWSHRREQLIPNAEKSVCDELWWCVSCLRWFFPC